MLLLPPPTDPLGIREVEAIHEDPAVLDGTKVKATTAGSLEALGRPFLRSLSAAASMLEVHAQIQECQVIVYAGVPGGVILLKGVVGTDFEFWRFSFIPPNTPKLL